MSGNVREHLARMRQQDAADDAARTRYVIKVALVYVVYGQHFTDRISDAKRFDSMTAANAYAITVTDLDPAVYSVEPV